MAISESTPPAASDPEQVRSRATFLDVLVALPKIGVWILVLVFLVSYHASIASLLERSTKVGLGPLSIEAAQQQLTNPKLKDARSDTAVYLTPDQAKTVADRLAALVQDGRNTHILWVDDNPINNRALVDFLDLLGYQVDVVRDYASAVQRLEERTYSVVLSDYGRPNDPASRLMPRSDPGPIPTKGVTYWGAGVPVARAAYFELCDKRAILFTSGSSPDRPTPPYVAAQTNQPFDLLMHIGDLIEKPLDPGCVAQNPDAQNAGATG